MARSDLHNMELWFSMAHRAAYDPAKLARELRVSPRQLRRYTKELFNATPRDWLNRRRMIVAADLLRQHRSIKEVAYDLGFKQLSHFSREFKRRHGICPSTFVLNNHIHPSPVQPITLTIQLPLNFT